MIHCSNAIIEYINYLEETLFIDTSKTHWLTDNVINRKRALKKLRSLFEKVGVLTPKRILRKNCEHKGCLNPFHYSVVRNPILYEISEERETEIEELTMFIDTEELQSMGFRAYFKDFNKDNPLPATKEDFFLACNRVLLRKKLPAISDLELKGL